MDVFALIRLPRHRAWLGYLVAALLAVGAYQVRALIGPVLTGFPFLTFFPAILIAALLGGRGPGILCAVVSGGLAWYYLVPPYGYFTVEWPAGFIALGLYAFIAALIVMLVDGLSRAYERAARAEAAHARLNTELEARVEARSRELEQAVAARQEADTLYRAYFEHTPEALFIVAVEPDGGFTVEQVNPAHEAGVGFRLADVRGRRVEEFLPPDVARRVLETYRHVVDSGATYQYREVYDLGGNPHHWDTSLVPVRSGDGRVTRLIGSSRDVTRQVVAEEALRQSQKMEAVGQLVAGLAHDFNNLLGAVMGSLDLIIRRAGDPDRVRHYAETGLQAAERGSKLTGQLLAFSRSQRVELKPMLVCDTVQEIRELLARTAGPLVRIEYDLNPNPVPVLCDPTQIETAIMNLVINARDAMPEGGTIRIATRTVELSGDAELEPGDYVELTVEDNGRGMDAATLARALDPFFTTKAVGQGTGLGLAQVYGIARQAGGTVRLESEVGRGTSVSILLRRTTAELEAAAADRRAAGPGRANEGAVLLVDDDADIRGVVTAMLEALGYEPLEASGGQEALDRLAERRPDLMIIDFAMPGMNGAEVAKAARARYPGLPIIFASGYSDTAAIHAAVGADANLIAKPFRMSELQDALAAARPTGDR